jgi:hypothetical protein
LTLDFADPKKILNDIRSKTDVLSTYGKFSLHDIIIRTETLNADLISLLHGPHAGLFSDVNAAEVYLQSQPAQNVSAKDHTHDCDSGPPAAILQMLQEREWFFFEQLGYPPYA